MSVIRALVDGVVLSLQGACVYYPCCKGCFSRIDVDLQDTTRCRCSKCGYSCPREQLDYRYRLSLRVSRDVSIFGVTVFGTCLNSFFGIHASGLQRLVEAPDGPVGASTKATLLRKAVEDCFIGRRFIFGLKLGVAGPPQTTVWVVDWYLRRLPCVGTVTKTESGPLFGGPSANDHFIASQMILPQAAGLGGCTVVSYYRALLQKAADFELGSTDPSKTSRPPLTDLLLIACNSPGRSFNNISLCAANFLPQSLQRLQHPDRTLTPTPPWQQSLGLVTSSAEQEEGCTQDSGDEDNTQTDNFRTPRHAQKGCLEDPKVTEETVLSPLLSLECRSYSNLSFSRYPHSPIEKAVGNTPILNTCFSPSPPGHNISRRLSTRQLTETFLPSSLAWDDLPFSESLTEFLCEENRNLDIVSEMEPHRNVQNQKETTRNNLKMRSQNKGSSNESTSDCQSNTQITDSESQILLDITNTPALNDRHDLSEQPCKNPAECKNKSQDRYKCHQENNKAIVLPVENEKEQLEEDTYNCSADLFGNSFMIDMNPNTPNMHAETTRTTTGACPMLSKPDRCHLRSEKACDPNSTPDKQKQKSNKCNRRDSLILPGTQDLDFIPPSQSTPIVKLAVVPGSPTSSYRTLTSGQSISQLDSQDSCALDNKKPAQIASSLCTLNFVGANQLGQCGRECTKENSAWSVTSSRHSHRFTPKRRFCKPSRHKNYLPAQQHLTVQRGALNAGSTGSINHDSSLSGVTVCDCKDIGAIIVPPTPAANTRQSVTLRRRHQADDSSSRSGCIQEGRQGDGIKCKRTLLDQTVTSSQKVLVQTGKSDSETVGDSSLDRSNCDFIDDENEACDWSRDLFSDSV